MTCARPYKSLSAEVRSFGKRPRYGQGKGLPLQTVAQYARWAGMDIIGSDMQKSPLWVATRNPTHTEMPPFHPFSKVNSERPLKIGPKHLLG